MKDIFTSDVYRLYWPEMVEKDEAKREKWSEREISLDNPARRDAYIRDPSIFTAGLTSIIVGMHCDIAVLDDVVVSGNAYTEVGREKGRDQYGLLSSIETARPGIRIRVLRIWSRTRRSIRWALKRDVTPFLVRALFDGVEIRA